MSSVTEEEEELSGRTDELPLVRSVEPIAPPSATLLTTVATVPKAQGRSLTPDPIVRAPLTPRPGISVKSWDVESVSINGASLGVETVWLAEVTAPSTEFCVDISLSNGVTIVVPHYDEAHDENWYAIAKDGVTRRRMLACFQPRECQPSSFATVVRLVSSPFAKDASALAVLTLAAAIALGVFGLGPGSIAGETAAAAAAASARRALGRPLPLPPPPPPPRSSIEVVVQVLPWAISALASAAHSIANGLDGIATGSYGRETGREASLPEMMLLVALFAAFVTRITARLKVGLLARSHNYYLIIKACAEAEALAVLEDGGLVNKTGGRSLIAVLTNTFRACAPEKREGNNGSESQELKVEALLVAFQSLKIIGEAIGPLMGLSVKNDESNVGKVRRVLARYGPQRVATVRALLEAEKASGVHRPGPILADPSAAMALLWMRRTIQYYIGVMRGATDTSNTLPSKCRAAYASILEPFHGWLLKQTFNMVLSAVPSRDEFIARLSPNIHSRSRRRSVFFADVNECIPLMEDVVTALQELFNELDLEDMRKS